MHHRYRNPSGYPGEERIHSSPSAVVIVLVGLVAAVIGGVGFAVHNDASAPEFLRDAVAVIIPFDGQG